MNCSGDGGGNCSCSFLTVLVEDTSVNIGEGDAWKLGVILDIECVSIVRPNHTKHWSMWGRVEEASCSGLQVDVFTSWESVTQCAWPELHHYKEFLVWVDYAS